MSVTRINAALAAYPVGSIYMSVNATSPATLFGGTWERIQDRFLLAAGSVYAAGSTGGAAKHKHTTGDHALTPNETAAKNHSHDMVHYHTLSGHTHGLQSHTHSVPAHKHSIHTVSPNLTSGTLNTNSVQFGRQANGYYNSNPFSMNASQGSADGGGSCTTGGPSNNTSAGPSANYTSGPYTGTDCKTWKGSTGGVTEANGAAHSHGDTGETSHMPPYIAVYMWKRTA